MKAELYYSPYAVHKPTDEINKYFENIISDGFKQVIQSVRKAELVKQEKLNNYVWNKNFVKNYNKRMKLNLVSQL